MCSRSQPDSAGERRVLPRPGQRQRSLCPADPGLKPDGSVGWEENPPGSLCHEETPPSSYLWTEPSAGALGGCGAAPSAGEAPGGGRTPRKNLEGRLLKH